MSSPVPKPKSHRRNISALVFILIFAALGGYFIFASHAATPLLGDLNNDGVVNVFDLSIFLSHWQQSGSSLPEDLNNDGVVNIFDLSILLSNYGQTSGGGAAPVNSIGPYFTASTGTTTACSNGCAIVGQTLGVNTGTWTNSPTS
jgi:dockerin type I repeat protein